MYVDLELRRSLKQMWYFLLKSLYFLEVWTFDYQIAILVAEYANINSSNKNLVKDKLSIITITTIRNKYFFILHAELNLMEYI